MSRQQPQDRFARPSLIGSEQEKSKGRRPHALRGALVLAAVCGLMPSAWAADDAGLARAKKCMNCHAIDQKLVGPAFKDVAARYASDKDAEARLAKKIREGGSGAWGVVPMPSNEVTPAEAQQLAHWVLMQK